MKKAWLAVSSIIFVGCGTGAGGAIDNKQDVGYDDYEIVGGTPTTETPAVVALYGKKPDSDQGSLCTATVITPNVLLTAAHCVHPSTVGEGVQFVVFTGADITNPETRGPGLPVQAVHFHPQWSSQNLQGGHDIAVAILAQPVNIAPIPFNTATLTQSIVGTPARIIGYGLNNGFNQTGAGVKRHATVKLNSFNAQFVATGSWFGQTICNGDSGGPILSKIDGVETIVGVNSFGFIFCLGEAQSTRVDANLDWLRQFVK